MEAQKIISLVRRFQQNEPTDTTAEKHFITVLREFNALDAADNNHSPKTKYKYENFADNFARYLHETGQPDLSIQAYSMPVIRNFTPWLLSNLKSCNKTHISKHIYRINKAADYGVIMGYIPYNPTAAYKVKRAKSKAVINLEQPEFNTWYEASWQTPIYQKAQDNQTFQMVTGLSYGDLFNYSTNTDDKGLWIEGLRSKTKRPFYIPLWHKEFAIALHIHEKYNGKLPFIENGTYNRIIREMAGILGIDKYLTSHVGRKTFATLKRQKGWATPPIATMLGNTEKVCSTHYTNIDKINIITELNRLT